MQLLRADADLCSKTKLVSIGKTGTGVDIDGCRVYLIQEPLRIVVIIGDNGRNCSG